MLQPDEGISSKRLGMIREFGFPADIGSLKTIVEAHDRETRIHAAAEPA